MLEANLTNANYAPEDRGAHFFIAWENIGRRGVQLRAMVYGHKIASTKGGLLVDKTAGTAV